MATTTTKKPRHQRHKRLPKGERGGIELLLIQNVEHLGKQGEVVEVRPGYASNYLLPQGLATVATEHHKRMVEKHKAKLATIARERLAGLRGLLEELVRTSVTIESNANDEGHLYGSVGAPEISRSLKQQDLVFLQIKLFCRVHSKRLGCIRSKCALRVKSRVISRFGLYQRVVRKNKSVSGPAETPCSNACLDEWVCSTSATKLPATEMSREYKPD